MIKRKIAETGSILYRRLVFPFKRISVELSTNSVLKQGSYINKGTVLEGRNYIGRDTMLSNVRLGFGSYVSEGGDLSNVRTGKYCAIGPGVKTVLGRHPLDLKTAALHPAFYSPSGAMGFTYFAGKNGACANSFEEAVYLDKEKGYQVLIGNDVWIGQDARIMEGVTIGDGAVIGAGAIVTKDAEPYGIYAGVPAKKVRSRFDDKTIEKLLDLCWWEKDEAWIQAHIDEFSDVERLLSADGGVGNG